MTETVGHFPVPNPSSPPLVPVPAVVPAFTEIAAFEAAWAVYSVKLAFYAGLTFASSYKEHSIPIYELF